ALGEDRGQRPPRGAGPGQDGRPEPLRVDRPALQRVETEAQVASRVCPPGHRRPPEGTTGPGSFRADRPTRPRPDAPGRPLMIKRSPPGRKGDPTRGRLEA